MTRCIKDSPFRIAAGAMTAAALLLAVPAHADEGLYLGLSGGLDLLDDVGSTVTTDGVGASGKAEFENGPAGGIVAGYTFANGLRPEIEFSYRRNRVDGAGDSDLRAGQAVASLYYNFSRNGYYFYAGGGGGYAKLRAGFDSAGFDSAGSDEDGTPVYSAGTGFGGAITRQLMLGIDYRYTGAFEDSKFSTTVDDAPVTTAFRYRGSFVGLALRYSFGSARADNHPVVGRAAEPVQVVPVAE